MGAGVVPEIGTLPAVGKTVAVVGLANCLGESVFCDKFGKRLKDMKIVVAPDTFKGCLPAGEVARVVADALREAHPDWMVVERPLSDGGEGTLETLVSALGGEMCHVRVSDPLGRPVWAHFGLCGDTAVVEVAQACGLQHLSETELNPLLATSYGVGELLLAARERGASHFLVGLGGTAVCDGGAGMMQVPGIREALSGCTLELLCDVDNPFVGPRGAARVFGPQKGARPQDVEVLEQRMVSLSAAMLAATGVDVRNMPGAGAAGGLGGALMAYFGAKAVSGAERVLDLVGFDGLLEGADLVITGEGQSDLQTLGGKLPYGVLKRAKEIPVVLLSGRIEDQEDLLRAGFARLVPVSPEGMPLEVAIQPPVARENLRRAVQDLVSVG